MTPTRGCTRTYRRCCWKHNRNMKTIRRSWKCLRRRTTRHASPSIGSAVLSRLSSFALIAIVALSAASCRSTKTMTAQTEARVERDSAENKLTTTKVVWTERVPQDQVHLIIPLDSIGQLPSGASFNNKNGRANVKASLGKQDDKDVIIIDASCDSLQMLCLYYEEQDTKLTKQNSELSNAIKTEKEQRSNPVKVAIFSFIVGLVSGIVITIKTRKKNG
nr:MAG TPA: hypothetical protein [Caudoviricetes sp.]